MARRDDVFPSRFLRASDLNGKPITVTIERAPLEKLKGMDGKEDTKTVLYFVGAKKCLPLNRTNWDTCADITNEGDSDSWKSHRIELYPTTTEMRGELTPCIRIRKPGQGELPIKKNVVPPPPKPSLADEMDDEIPF